MKLVFFLFCALAKIAEKTKTKSTREFQLLASIVLRSFNESCLLSQSSKLRKFVTSLSALVTNFKTSKATVRKSLSQEKFEEKSFS